MIYSMPFIPVSTYTNNGQKAEYDASYNLTGIGKKPDRIRGIDKPDFMYNGIGIQCKSARATVCIGLDYKSYILYDCKCDKFLYVCYRDCRMYFFDKQDFLQFVNEFHTVDIDTYTKKQKIRLKKESCAMVLWLIEHCTMNL